MADSAISAILTTFRPQFVATNEGSRAVLWKGLAVVVVEINPSAEITNQPLSSDSAKDAATTEKIKAVDIGIVKILRPSRMRVTAIISDLSTLENIVSTFKNETVTLSINTKTIITNNLIMTDLEITQEAGMVSASKVEMTFEQADSPDGSNYKPEQAADATTNAIGAKKLITSAVGGGFGSLANTISGAIDRVPVTILGPLLNNIGGPLVLNNVKNGMLA